MSDNKVILAKYQKQYAELRFERGDLFKLISEKYHPTGVLYPGCSIHITPAFYFPHVVFVDKDRATLEFFSNHEVVLDFVMRNRQYRRKPYIHFIPQDFTKPLPVPENQFDLVLSLFTGDVSRACKQYLKTGGLLLTNNHQNDAVEAAQKTELTLIASVQFRRGRYQLIENNPDRSIKIKSQKGTTKNYLRQTSSGVEYIENEIYYVFKKNRPRQ